jgi:hypothetical protein
MSVTTSRHSVSPFPDVFYEQTLEGKGLGGDTKLSAPEAVQHGSKRFIYSIPAGRITSLHYLSSLGRSPISLDICIGSYLH